MYYTYLFNASSSNTTVMFGFQHNSGYWDLDNIELWDLTTFQNIFQDGGFNSGSLSPNYGQCQSSGNISNVNPFNGTYCYSDGTTGQFGYPRGKSELLHC
ncbi:unnamed protein product [Rotaria socialis]|nr:unnamed protein product [Rotaria socialis]